MHIKSVVDIMDILGANILIVHAGDLEDEYTDSKFNRLCGSIEEILTYSENKKIKIAIENIATPLSKTSVLLNFVETLNSDRLGICLDIAHANLNENIEDVILTCVKYILATHISDNDGLSDQHYMPGEGIIEWNSVTQQLHNVNYTGTFTLELRKHNGLKNTLDRLKSGLKQNFFLKFYSDQENMR